MATELNMPGDQVPSKGGYGINALALATLTMSGTLNMLTLGFAVQSKYIKTTAVVMSELTKTAVSFAMLVKENNGVSGAVRQIRENCFDHTLAIMALPAVLYAIANITTIYIVAYLDPAMFQVFGQLKIVTTAIFCRILLNKILTPNQTMAVLLLLTGVITVKVAQANPAASDAPGKDSGEVFIGVILALLQATSSGFCGAYLEKQFKEVSPSGGANIWTKNVQLAGIGVLISSLTIVLRGDMAAIMDEGFFQNYNLYVWSSILLSALGGILNAIIMKYADNIVKGFAVAISMILTVFLSAFFFAFQLNIGTLFGSGLVIAATLQYSGQLVAIADDAAQSKMYATMGIGFAAAVAISCICLYVL